MGGNQELNERLEEIAKGKSTKLGRYYKYLDNTIKTLVNSSLFNLAIVEGEAGIGKSFQVKKKLENMNTEFEELKGHLTTLEFYNKLWEMKNKNILLDDVGDLLNSKDRRSFIKCATDTTTRQVDYRTSRTIKAPESFEFGGNIIIVLNSLGRLGTDREAILSRGFHIKIELTYEQILEIIFELCKKDLGLNMKKGEKLEVARWVKENTSEATENLNIRTFYRLLTVKKQEIDWKDYARENILQENETLSLCLELLESNKPMGGIEKEFKKRTGKSRRELHRNIRTLSKKLNEDKRKELIKKRGVTTKG